MNHFKVMKKLSSLNFDEIEILREEDSLSGEKLQREIFKSVSLEDYAHRYFLTLIFRKSDCSICLNYVIPLLQEVKNIKVVGIYADDDTISFIISAFLYFKMPEQLKRCF